MSRLQLASEKRTNYQKSETKRLRREGRVPATVYGKDFEAQSVSVQEEEFMALLKVPGGRQSLIDLAVEGMGTQPVMIQEIQRTQISRKVLHVNFHKVNMNETTHVTVPVQLVGEPIALKLGGVLEQITSELEVRALPDRIPTHISVDASGLDLNDNLHVSDVKVPEGVEILTPADTVVAVIRIPAATRAAAEGEAAG